MTPLQYFKQFFLPNVIDDVVEQTNALPSYKCYWSPELRYPLTLENLHFVNNDNIDQNDKLAKVGPITDDVRNECVKIEPEEYHSVDEQIIPSKTKFSPIPQKTNKWGFKNLVRAGSSGFLYDFSIYEGKSNGSEVNDNDYKHLQKSSQVVARLYQTLPSKAIFRQLVLDIGFNAASQFKRNTCCGYNSNQSVRRVHNDERQIPKSLVVARWTIKRIITPELLS